MRNRYGEIVYDLIVFRGLPYLGNRVADLKGKFGLGAGKALGRVFKAEIAARLRPVFRAELCTENGDLDYFLL